jgi:hypothetical protein
MTDFGRCSLAVEAHYDDAAARALFLGADGDDAFRLRRPQTTACGTK